MNATHYARHLGAHFVLHLHGFHDGHAAPRSHCIAFRHVDGHHCALQRCGHQRFAFVGGRCVGGWLCRAGFAAIGQNRQRIVGIDLGTGGHGRIGDGVRRGHVQRREVVEAQGPLGCESGGEQAVLEVRVVENRSQIRDVGVHTLDAELSEGAAQLGRNSRKRRTGSGHHLSEQRVIARAGGIAGVAEGVGAQARPGRWIEGGKHAAGRQCIASFGHPLHVDPSLDGEPGRAVVEVQLRKLPASGNFELRSH